MSRKDVDEFWVSWEILAQSFEIVLEEVGNKGAPHRWLADEQAVLEMDEIAARYWVHLCY
jgi:hypothetical protein